jgi:hypothetical protein
MTPGTWLYWHHTPRGGYGSGGELVPAVVVSVGPKRVSIFVYSLRRQCTVRRSVLRENLVT